MSALAAAAAGPTAEEIGTWVGRNLLGPAMLVVAAAIVLWLGVAVLGRSKELMTLLVVIGLVTFLKVGPVQGMRGVPGSDDAPPSAAATRGIPADYLAHYQQAADTCPALSWQVLAAVGKVESDHGRSRAPGVRSGVNRHGCCAGPMQFNLTNGPPSTWALYARPGDSVYDPADAIPAAARKLCHDGLAGPPGGRDPCPSVGGGTPALHRALKRYNNACWYVVDVVAQAERYGARL